MVPCHGGLGNQTVGADGRTDGRNNFDARPVYSPVIVASSAPSNADAVSTASDVAALRVLNT